MAAIPPPQHRRDTARLWAGAVGLALGSALGAAACWALAHLL